MVPSNGVLLDLQFKIDFELWNCSTGSAYSLGNTSICSEDRSSKTMFTVPSKSIVQMVHVRVVVVHKSS